ncbi:MAG: phage tail protein [Thermodesulfobacteriota bacterium]
MGRVQWTRAAQFNWVFDNMGGTPLQEVVAGNWDQAVTTVQADGTVAITTPNPGGGQVYWMRGVWTLDALFPWEGFWVDPMNGDLTNYYTGGAFVNEGTLTTVTLGTALPPGTAVQLYYIYFTGEVALKYEPLNDYPCIRRAYRDRDDYSYDFAVDRMLDLMVFLHLAGQARGRDYGPLIRFLWDAFLPREESRTSPLVYDDFERQRWDRGAYLLYRNSTLGDNAFQIFQNDLVAGQKGRLLHVRAELPSARDAAWFGYGLDYSLTTAPFSEMDRLTFTLQGNADTSRLHNLTKIGSGSATLVLLGDYAKQEKQNFTVEIESTGEVGAATFRWSKDGGVTWEAEGLLSGDREHPVILEEELSVAWESGDGIDLVAGDLWNFWGGEPSIHPRRLLVIMNDAEPDEPEPFTPQHSFVHAIPDRFAEATAFELPFSQFWRLDNIIDDPDRVQAMWGTWYSASQGDTTDITVGTREETEIILGETFYTQRYITWDLSPYVTSFGVWVGINTARCNSSGHANLNFLIKPEVSGAATLTIRVKVKDAQGSYFYRDESVQAGVWQRVTVNLGELSLESGVTPLSHPLQVVDIGIPTAPPSNGAFTLTDLKFGDHVTFAAASRLKVLEFKMEQQGLTEHEWWVDKVALNLEASDPYPYAPRLAISLTPYGQNPWRGPTLVHYVQPLAPYLVGAMDIRQTYLQVHREAQQEFTRRYGGVPGPIVPVHTRNDVENIALCGEEDFLKFSWWPKYRNYGLVSGAWHFNEALTDASGNDHTLWWSAGSPVYTSGVCQPGSTAVTFDGSAHGSLASNAMFEPGTQDFSLTIIVKGLPQAAGYQWFLDKMGADGWVVQSKSAGDTALQLKVTTSAGDSYSDIAGVLDGDWHMLTWMVSCTDGKIYKVKDKIFLGEDTLLVGTGINNNAYLNVGAGGVFSLDYFKYERRAVPAAEYGDTWDIVRGLSNGSAYPEVGNGLGQYWAFLRLAEDFFVTDDAGAWEILTNWLTWIDTYGAPDGDGWKIPTLFSEYGFCYGTYDPGMTASVALGCLWIYLRNGDARAATWARRFLDDLRENRWDPEYGGYKSGYHYAWLNALVTRAFGLAAQGAAGQAYAFPAQPEDREHFETLMAWLFDHAGDEKPNILNADLIPFYYSEAADVWDNAPHYLATGQVGTLEAVVAMAGAALEYGKSGGDWEWWQKLLDFILEDHLMVLSASQIRSLTTTYEQAGAKNLVRVLYGDYDQDNTKYAEARKEDAIQVWGEQPVSLDFRYGSAVVMEDPEMAQLLASRLLARLAAPRELAEVETWLEGVRLELGDIVAVTSDFHGFAQDEFTLSAKEVDLGRRSVRLSLERPLKTT